MLLGNMPLAFQDEPALLARLSARNFEFSIGHGVQILGTSEIRYGVGLGVEWGRPSKALHIGRAVRAREHAYVRLFRSFIDNEGFDGIVLGIGGRWHGTTGWFKNGYLEAGSGVSVSDGVSIDVNSHFNFVSHIGGGFFLSSNVNAPRVGIRWVHVSNAEIEPPNRGLNQFEAVVGFKF